MLNASCPWVLPVPVLLLCVTAMYSPLSWAFVGPSKDIVVFTPVTLPSGKTPVTLEQGRVSYTYICN